MNKVLSIGVLIVLAFFGAPQANAAMFGGETYTLQKDQILNENLYVGAGNVSILGSVIGDAILFGGKVLINGPITGDVAAGGGTVDILSSVSGDIRVAGGDVTIGDAVGGDLVVLGGTVQVLPGTVIAGDVLVAGGTLNLDGAVTGDVTVRSGSVTLNGPIAGSANVRGTDGFSFGPAATISGTLTYRAPEALEIREGAVAGGITYDKIDGESAMQKGVMAGIILLFGMLFLMKFFGMLLGSVIAVTAFPVQSHRLMEGAIARFGSTFLVGFAVLVATPILAIILMVTLIGIIPGILLMLGYLTLLVVSGIYAGILVGAFLSNWWKKEIRTTWKWAVLGTFVLTLLSFLPFFGGLACFVFFSVALGALARHIHMAWKNRHGGEMVAE